MILCKDVGFGKEQRLMKDKVVVNGRFSIRSFYRVWLWIRVRKPNAPINVAACKKCTSPGPQSKHIHFPTNYSNVPCPHNIAKPKTPTAAAPAAITTPVGFTAALYVAVAVAVRSYCSSETSCCKTLCRNAWTSVGAGVATEGTVTGVVAVAAACSIETGSASTE